MDISRIDLNLLLIFHALAEEGSVTGAAKRLRTSQPTVSYSLKKLRALFADELFIRSGSGMRPTPFAAKITPSVRQLIELVQNDLLFERNFDPLTTERTFSFCMSDISELVFLPPLLAAMKEEAPNANVETRSVEPDELYDRLGDGSIDIALGSFFGLATQDIFQQALFSHPFVCIARKDNPIGKDGLSREEFLDADHVVISEKGRSTEAAEKRIGIQGLNRRVILKSPHFMTIPLVIAESDYVSIVPKAVGRAYARKHNLKMMALPFALPQIELKQFWHRGVHKDPAIIWMRGLIARLFLKHDPSDDPASAIFATDEEIIPAR